MYRFLSGALLFFSWFPLSKTEGFVVQGIVDPRQLETGSRTISAGIPYT